jgi:hypothetical protein
MSYDKNRGPTWNIIHDLYTITTMQKSALCYID